MKAAKKSAITILFHISCHCFITCLLSFFRGFEVSLAALHDASHVRQTITSIGTMHEEVEEDEEEEEINQLYLNGSSSHYFVEPCGYHHNQFELVTHHQMRNEIFLLRVSKKL
jgi:hypothetical protein